ncbi:MAG: sodium/glutamate symporter [Sporomusaceae bacterium]|nr:sodium/glutamate symporter [Sporomusaceae bacterium]
MKGADLLNLMLYVSYLGGLLFVGKILRAKITLFQRLYFPAALIAGFLGLALGPFGVKLIPVAMMNTWSILPGRLIDIVFACVFLGTIVPSVKQIWQYAGPQLVYSWFVVACQWIVGIGLTYFIIQPIWNIPAFVGTIIEIGWVGGHGTAGGMAVVFKNLGFPEGGDLGLTSATVGLVVGIIVGMIYINIAVRKGYTSVLESPDQIKTGNLSGILPPDQEKVIAKSRITTDSIEPFALHLGLIGISVIIGWYMLQGLTALHPKFNSVPLFPLAMIGGVIIQLVANITKTDGLINRQVVERIQGTALDFLVVAAVASIKVPVVIKYAIPLLILMAGALVLMHIVTWYLAPRIFPDSWFERGIAEYGALCGVLAVGLMLLRVVDPDLKTAAPKAFAFERPFFSPFVGGGLVTAVVPIFVHELGALAVIGASAALAVALMGLAYLCGWFRPHPGAYR